MPHVVFDEDLSYIENQIAGIKNELLSIENIIKQVRGEEQKKSGDAQKKTRIKLRARSLSSQREQVPNSNVNADSPAGPSKDEQLNR